MSALTAFFMIAAFGYAVGRILEEELIRLLWWIFNRL